MVDKEKPELTPSQMSWAFTLKRKPKANRRETTDDRFTFYPVSNINAGVKLSYVDIQLRIDRGKPEPWLRIEGDFISIIKDKAQKTLTLVLSDAETKDGLLSYSFPLDKIEEPGFHYSLIENL